MESKVAKKSMKMISCLFSLISNRGRLSVQLQAQWLNTYMKMKGAFCLYSFHPYICMFSESLSIHPEWSSTLVDVPLNIHANVKGQI